MRLITDSSYYGLRLAESLTFLLSQIIKINFNTSHFSQIFCLFHFLLRKYFLSLLLEKVKYSGLLIEDNARKS